MITESVWEGVQSLLDHYLEVRADDHVILAYTSDTVEHMSWVSVALGRRNVHVERVWMIPLRDPDFAERFAAALPQSLAAQARIMVLTFERDTLSHDSVLRAGLSECDADKVKVYRVISTCDELFTGALKAIPEDLSAKNTTLLDALVPATSLRITTEGGSDLTVGIDSDKHRWISNRGIWRPGRFIILPAGEVATFPASIEGKFVGDFAFNVNMITDRDARLDSRPVTVWIEENRAVRYECDDETISKFLDECFYSDCAYIVGELGFGTNGSVQTPISSNSHINERHTGVHLGFGQSNQAPDVVGYDCNIHLDLIAKGGKIWVDDNPTPLDLEDISLSPNPHPIHTRDEDARSSTGLDDLQVDDCCGILTSEGISMFKPESPH